MKNPKIPDDVRRRSGMTIIEISVTLSVMLMLASVVFYSTSGIDEWKKGRNAGMELQSVYLAQKSFLADRPTSDISAIGESDLIPYMNGITSIPTIEALDGGTKTIDITQMPPVISGGYDPSDSTDDGLWDVGKH